MINAELHKDPTALDTVAHRKLRLDTGLNATERFAPFASAMITFAEFGPCSREYPILFVMADKDEKTGRQQVAPVAMFGLDRGENLFVTDNQWTGEYLPAMFRSYPFTLARVDENDRWALVFDASWQGVSEGGKGEALFDDAGKATPFLEGLHKFTQDIEHDIERTRVGGQELLAMNLLKPMRFDATLPDGKKVTLDGFLTVDEDKLQNLPDAQVVQLHRNGLLGLLHIHRLSLVNMQRVLQRRVARENLAAAKALAGAANS